jgi:endogenous inhibitor of DNA gyrase (YacG/DUF329 family)
MGMFDWISVPTIDCPYCGKEIPDNSGWQSKDDDCQLDTIPFHKETIERFYTSCPHCDKWIEYKRKPDFDAKGYLKHAYELVQNDY